MLELADGSFSDASICLDCYCWSLGTMGNDDEHASDWECPEPFCFDEYRDEWGDVEEHFSWAPCDTCGSSLGGTRYSGFLTWV